MTPAEEQATGVDGTAADLAARVADLLAERDELASGLPVGFYTGWFDTAAAAFHFDYVSGRAAEFLGVPADELVRDWRSMFRNVDPEHVAALEYEGTAVTEPGDEVDWTGRVVHGGRELWLHISARESVETSFLYFLLTCGGGVGTRGGFK